MQPTPSEFTAQIQDIGMKFNLLKAMCDNGINLVGQTQAMIDTNNPMNPTYDQARVNHVRGVQNPLYQTIKTQLAAIYATLP